MIGSFNIAQFLNELWTSFSAWIGDLLNAIIRLIQTHIAPIYYANKSWIWFCIILLIVLEIINILLFKGFESYVKKNSPIYKEIQRINNDYPFFKIPKDVTFYQLVNQRAQFDNCNIENYSRRELKNFDSSLYRFYTSVERNRLQLGSYDKMISRIQYPFLSDQKGRLYTLLFKKYEEQIYQKSMAYPETNPRYHLVVKFRTPAGRNSGKKQYSANHAYMRHLYDKAYGYTQYQKMDTTVDDYRRKANGVPLRNEQKEFEKAQRNLMTKKLRVQILQRDNYTCQYCGKYMPDGVGAHVDHIIPVSKGGLTEPNNLQVLCSVCNGRKSNRIE